MGGGGYVAGPAGLAALLARLPLVLAEADRHLGLANRLLAGRARRVCLAFPIAGREGARYLVTGRPVPAAVLTAIASARGRASGSMRTALPAGVRRQPRRPLDQPLRARRVRWRRRQRRSATSTSLHITGRRDYPEARAGSRRRAGRTSTRCSSTSRPWRPARRLRPRPGRAGGSVFELAAAGRPAILVPVPARHGAPPARQCGMDGGAGAALVLEDSELAVSARSNGGRAVRRPRAARADGRGQPGPRPARRGGADRGRGAVRGEARARANDHGDGA